MVLRKGLSARPLVWRAIILTFALGCDKKGPVAPPSVVDATFKIEVRFFGPEPSAQLRAAFENAQARIEAMITSDLPDARLNNINLADNKTCGVPVTINETVDDLVIYATVKAIDGVGKVQASSGPCLVRSTGKLPVVGKMEMDVEDVSQLANTGRLNAVVLHEMLHVLGFGTIWDQVTPARLTGANTADSRFSGPLAIQACVDAGGSSICAGGVPVESCVGISGCGEGTRDSHWRESVFRAELMTGYVEAVNVPMPLSAMTIQSFADMGYSVTTTVADSYRIPGTAIRLPDDDAAATQVPWELTRRPAFEVTANGELQRR
ncbi:MAG: hypothetical protein H0U64_07615 [Gemmatimonadaceae bacterium]|nr:hypothetical protein [Gemmatimonadaceae bacterium]